MPTSPHQPNANRELAPFLGMFAPAVDYMVDAAQRGVLFCDVNASARRALRRQQEEIVLTSGHA